jgi:hypothetical protein
MRKMDKDRKEALKNCVGMRGYEEVNEDGD